MPKNSGRTAWNHFDSQVIVCRMLQLIQWFIQIDKYYQVLNSISIWGGVKKIRSSGGAWQKIIENHWPKQMQFGINVCIVINIMYCLFLILSVSNNSKCKKRFSGRFGMVQNDFRDVSGTVVKKVNFNPCAGCVQTFKWKISLNQNNITFPEMRHVEPNPKHWHSFHVRHIREQVVATQGNNAEQLPPSQQQHPHWLVTGHPRRAHYEEVTLTLREGKWKSAVNGDFFQPSFHFLSNEVCCTCKGKLVLLSGVTMMHVLLSSLLFLR